MSKEIIELTEDVSSSPLYSEDLAPVPPGKRTWGKWDLAAIWVGMAVCIPTYLLAAEMIASGVSWYAALIIIGLANLIITVPMVLNGHGGVKYGIPFPVIGRAAFGTMGVHIPAVVRAIVACGWFGIQTWIGGGAFYSIWMAVTGGEVSSSLSLGHFIGFGVFWLLNVYIIWKGIETIRWMENLAAPILILIGLVLIGWGAYQAKGFGVVLDQSQQLEKPTAVLSGDHDQGLVLTLNPITDKDQQIKATEYLLTVNGQGEWKPLTTAFTPFPLAQVHPDMDQKALKEGTASLQLKVRAPDGQGFIESSSFEFGYTEPQETTFGATIWKYLLWLTGMVGFWATMSISIADITRYASTQKQQVAGQFLGLPGAMILYSFVGIFVTCAAVINFKDVLIAGDAPWDPVLLLSKFDSPVVVIIAQVFMIIATLSTNIAANVIAPANAFSNLIPQKISFRVGGVIAAVIGILICPWWLLGKIISLLVFVSGLLGPVLGILICDYFVIRKKELKLSELYKPNGIYAYTSGLNMTAIAALALGVAVALVGYFVPSLAFLYNLSWFTGFAVAFGVYWGGMRGR